MMAVQKYLQEHGIEKLVEELSIIVTDYPDRIVLNYNQIDSPRFHPICDECRALILRKHTWEVLARSFDRFYNVGEGEDWKNFPIEKARIEEKLDGSLISVYHDGNQWCVSTRKMAFAEGILPIGITFRDLFDKAIKNTKIWEVLNSNTVGPYFTWVFELTAPENRIVTPYKEQKVTLIGARSKSTSDEMTPEGLDTWADLMGVNRPLVYQCNSIEELQEKASSLTSMNEGFVLVYKKEGNINPYLGSEWRLKCKNPKYVAIAHMRENGTISPKRIMTLIMANEQHEYLQYFEEDAPYFKFCNEIYQESIDRINQIAKEHMSIKEQKDFALTIIPLTKYSHEKGILFKMRKGMSLSEILKEVDGKKMAEALNLKEKFKKAFNIDEDSDI